MFGSAGNIDRAGARQAANKPADRGTSVPGGTDVGVVEHGVAISAHASFR